MRVRYTLALLPALLLASPLLGESVRELSRLELRQLLDSGAAEDPRRAMKTAQGQAGGEVLDIRAFQGNAVYYRILVKKLDGQVVSIVVDAMSGVLLAASSSSASSVNAAARIVGSGAVTAASASVSASASDASAKPSAGANARSNGNTDGNSGRSGNSGDSGNAGGNGNGHGK